MSRPHDDPAFTGLARPASLRSSRASPPSDLRLHPSWSSPTTSSRRIRARVAWARHADNGDGQGNANAIRVAQAQALASFRFDKPTLPSSATSTPTPRRTRSRPSKLQVGRTCRARGGFLRLLGALGDPRPRLRQRGRRCPRAGATSWAVNAPRIHRLRILAGHERSPGHRGGQPYRPRITTLSSSGSH